MYIVSNKSRSLYTGVTTDLIKRVEQHKTGAYPSAFTARYRFTKLVYFESAQDLAAAAKREKEIKAWSREEGGVDRVEESEVAGFDAGSRRGLQVIGSLRVEIPPRVRSSG